MFINIALSISDETIDSIVSETKDDNILDDFKEIFNKNKVHIYIPCTDGLM